MPGWLWFAPLAVLVVALGLWAFRLGWIAATISETDVIERYAALYMQTQGDSARATDCVARPGVSPRVWIVVSCLTPQGVRVDYPVDRLGRLLDLAPEPTTMPQT